MSFARGRAAPVRADPRVRATGSRRSWKRVGKRRVKLAPSRSIAATSHRPLDGLRGQPF